MSAVGCALMSADHRAKKQQDKNPPDELKGNHWLPYATSLFFSACVGSSRHSTLCKWHST
jgi:hypothetical protein